MIVPILLLLDFISNFVEAELRKQQRLEKHLPNTSSINRYFFEVRRGVDTLHTLLGKQFKPRS